MALSETLSLGGNINTEPVFSAQVGPFGDQDSEGKDVPGLLEDNFRGAVAMLHIFASALSADESQCVYETGRRLVQSGQMAQLAASDCRGPVRTGCSSDMADNSPRELVDIDDGSCRFEPTVSAGESGVVTVRDAWQRVPLRHVYVRPIVVCGVNTRGSTTQAVTQIRRLEAASDGTWSFDVRASQRSCHFANPPATAEHMSYIVVEAGACAEG